MVVIGITGPTGVGKTTALDALSGLGAAVIDCDAVYHELLTSSEQMCIRDSSRGCPTSRSSSAA